MVKFKKKLFVQILGLLITTFTIVIGTVLYQGQQLKQNLAEKEITNGMNLIRIEISKFYQSVETAIAISSSYAEHGLFVKRSIENINTKFIPLLAETKAVHSIEITGTNGGEYFLGRHPNGWIAKSYANDTINICRQYLIDSTLQVFSEKDTLIARRFVNSADYLYLKENLTKEEILWSKPGSLAGQKNVGFFGSKMVSTKDDNLEYTLSFNISLNSIYNLLDSLLISESGQIFAFTPSREVFFEQPQDSITITTDINPYLVKHSELKNEVLFQAIEQWEPDTSKPYTIKPFRANGKKWWVGFTNNKEDDVSMMIAVIISEDDFSSIIKGRNKASLIILSIVLIFLIAGFFIFFRNFTDRTSLGNTSIDNLTNDKIHELIAKGESITQEFKSTVRMNLKSGQAGKEIEIAWLKSVVGFLNTTGGNIIIGVEDDGNIIGIEADRFPNDDKCRLHIQNLIKQHVGLEFTNYVRFKLYKLNEKTVLVIQCKPTDNPVFLKHGEKEQFYIRSGPASVELSVSKALKYIEDRKKQER